MKNIIIRNGNKIVLVYIVVSILLLIISFGINFWTEFFILNLVFMLGFSLGWLAYKYGNREFYLKNINEFTTEKENALQNTIGNALRRIYFSFGKNGRNYSFLCTFKVNDYTMLQLTHTSHFPQLNKTINDFDFGIVLYIKLDWMSHLQKRKLEKIIESETKPLCASIINPEYYLFNIGVNIRFGIHIIYLILKNVFEVDSPKKLKIFMENEGQIPYSNIS